MNNKYKGMITGAFVGDALALGAHWVYNTSVIDRKAPKFNGYMDPIPANYHPNRSAGEHTHYGDQMHLFYDYLKKSVKFNPEEYLQIWSNFFDSYDGYRDSAMKETKQNLESGQFPSGSKSTDLAGVFYVPPLMVLEASDDKHSDVESAVKMTHDSEDVVGAASFLVDLLEAVLGGMNPIASISKLLKEGHITPELKLLIQGGIDSVDGDSRTVIAGFGQACSTEQGLPGAIHLICRYEEDFERALIENVLAGGDSASRGIFVGAVLGAYHGYDGIPQRWLAGLIKKPSFK